VTYLSKKWQWRLNYTVSPVGLIALPHQMRLHLNVVLGGLPGLDFADFEVEYRNGVQTDLATYSDILTDLIEPIYGSTAQFTNAELWAADTGSEDWIFYSVLPIGHAGSHIGTNVANNAQIMTFRCQNGNSMRVQLAETVVAAGAKDPYPFSNSQSAALAAHISGLTSAVVNKRFSYPIAPINNCVEQNETYWDARNR
jgi:hypothetical protein